ncbi:MAG: DUF2723 domain-containing protein [Anaerolineae bacterium]
MRTFYLRYQPIIAFCCALAVLLRLYLPTLQTIPNGADHYYMADVGETQVVLNVWGTLHATGYPLYVMLSSALVALFKLVGVSPAAAPSLTSLVWGIVSLALLYTLLLHLSRHIWLSALLLIPFGLMRTVWIHSVIPEIYSFSLIFLLLLLLVALWQKTVRHRVYWLAFIGGLGVFNHRALIMVAPALLYAVWGELAARPRQLPRVLLVCLLLGLLGFLPYLYLPLRAWSGAHWVYGDPGTWQGFLDQFLGREADRYVGLRDSWDALVANFNLVNNVLLTDVTLLGIALGIAGLGYAATVKTYRRAAVTLLLSAAFAYGFHVLFYSDILSALILPILVSLVGGWFFAALWFYELKTHIFPLFDLRDGAPLAKSIVIVLFVLFFAGVITANQQFILSLTTDPRGIETIEQVRAAPPDTTLMIGWGTNHSAAGYAQEVLGLLPDVTLVDHNADLAAVIHNGTLITPEYSFYTFPLNWWQNRLAPARLSRYRRAISVRVPRRPLPKPPAMA